ncbi:aldo/keto reductase [Streptomyces sp. NPDC048594]|uniref:aldo/keto reductase n=1 Tax=Streptomyces sp. NPDC048594 TaxID=3365575 RepID=UPI003721C2C8
MRARHRELRHRLGAGAEPGEARRIFDRFAEAGGTFLDSAEGYQFGESEELTGKLISADRDHFVLATKFTLGAAPQPDISRTGNSRRNMVASVEAILKRLGTDYIDLLWVHFPERAHSYGGTPARTRRPGERR